MIGRVTVVVPAFNEEKTIGQVLMDVSRIPFVSKIIVVDDGSRDKTLTVARKALRAASKHGKAFELIHYEKNRGKGYALRKAFKFIKNGLVIIQDADLEYSPEDYPKLIAALDKSSVVFGNRFVLKNEGHEYFLAKLGNRFASFIFSLLYGQKIHDLNVGYKAFRVSALKGIVLKEDGFLIEEELAVGFAKKGIKIQEVPIHYRGRTFEEGKKIRAKDGIMGVIFLLKKRFLE